MDWPEARDHLPFVNRMVMTLARRAPFLLGLLFKAMGGVASGDREKELAQMKGRMPPADFAAFSEPGRLEAFGAAMKESMRQGTKGAVREMGLYVRDFGFDPGAVRCPLVWLHGEKDANAPIALARKAASLVPASRLIVYPDEAHLSTLCNHFGEAAAAIRESWPN
jgi:pimeloyl-ACP methyl ester carboxylesterase